MFFNRTIAVTISIVVGNSRWSDPLVSVYYHNNGML